jgi:hypothetical protein
MASPNQTTPRQIDWKQVGDYLLGRSTLIGLASLMLGGRGRGVRPAMPSHQQIEIMRFPSSAIGTDALAIQGGGKVGIGRQTSRSQLVEQKT